MALTSAFLFGVKWRKSGNVPFEPCSFFKKRIKRIYIPLWLTIIAILPIELLIKGEIDYNCLAYNLLGLGWAYPLRVAGHLWYITLMMLLYLAFFFFSKWRFDKKKISVWSVLYISLILVAVFKEGLFTTFSRVAPLLALIFSSLLFYKVKECVEIALNHKSTVWLLTFSVTLLSYMFYLSGWHESHKAWATISSFSSGLLIFICMITFCKLQKRGKLLQHLSNLSYEIYLVHLPLLPLINYLLGGNRNSMFVPLWLFATYISALTIHVLANKLDHNNQKRQYV